jgi:two-component system chemotaxis response regulator CheB
VLPVLTRHASAPLFIVQHFPQGMTRYFADSLGKKCDYRVAEASDGEAVQLRTAYIAPGGRHMIVRKHDAGVVTALNDQPPENGCRPSVDVLFRSVAAVYPQSVVAIILTGMGCDGARALGPMKRSGAYVIAQDEATSVVWGMPGAAVATSQVDEVLALEAIGPRLVALLGTGTTPCT